MGLSTGDSRSLDYSSYRALRAAVIGLHVEKNPREGICRARAYRALHAMCTHGNS